MITGPIRRAAMASVLTAMTLFACAGPSPDATDESSSAVAAASKNLCIGQAANTFHCIDDTSFELCIGSDKFVVNACPKGLCATRHPANENPCIGAARAREIDGVPPTPPNQVDGSGAGNTGGANNNAGNTNGGNAGNTGNSGGAASNDAGKPAAPSGANNGTCVGGPKFDPAGTKNVGNGAGHQFIGGQCLRAADCASGCCALPCGICSGPGAQFQAGKLGCGFGG